MQFNIHTILAIVFFLIIIVFSTLKIEYKSININSNIPIDLLDDRTNTGIQQDVDISIYNTPSNSNTISNNNKVKRAKIPSGYNSNRPQNDLWGLPDKDKYMTSSFREQIDNLHDRYYNDIGPFANI